jgi:hypothetical protein
MSAVRVMEMAVDEIIDVVAVGYGLVAAAGAVDVGGIMGAAVVLRGAGVGVGRREGDGVFVDVAIVEMVQVAIVKIVDVIAVLDGGMTAARLMLMSMFRMSVAG